MTQIAIVTGHFIDYYLSVLNPLSRLLMSGYTIFSLYLLLIDLIDYYKKKKKTIIGHINILILINNNY